MEEKPGRILDLSIDSGSGGLGVLSARAAEAPRLEDSRKNPGPLWNGSDPLVGVAASLSFLTNKRRGVVPSLAWWSRWPHLASRPGGANTAQTNGLMP